MTKVSANNALLRNFLHFMRMHKHNHNKMLAGCLINRHNTSHCTEYVYQLVSWSDQAENSNTNKTLTPESLPPLGPGGACLPACLCSHDIPA